MTQRRKRITFDRDDMDYINEMRAREHSDRNQLQMSSTVCALVCLGLAGWSAKYSSTAGLVFFGMASVLGLISWLVDPDK